MTKINRSTYQKVVEENKRLLADIEILCSSLSEPELFLKRAEVRNKWVKYFKDKKQFNELLHEAAKEYIKNHTELKIPKV